MSIKKKILLVILTLGIILSGVGAAVMVLDFSTFTYNKEVVIGEDNLKNITLSYDFGNADIERIHILHPLGYGRLKNDNVSVIADENMPEGRIQMELSYNPDYISPVRLEGDISEYSEFDLYDNEHTANELCIEILNNGVYRGVLKPFMQMYRDGLNNIKNKTLSSYRLAEIEKCVIRINPKYEQILIY